MDFKEWFCLNQRESFTIDAKINPKDAQFYFGRKELDDRMTDQRPLWEGSRASEQRKQRSPARKLWIPRIGR